MNKKLKNWIERYRLYGNMLPYQRRLDDSYIEFIGMKNFYNLIQQGILTGEATTVTPQKGYKKHYILSPSLYNAIRRADLADLLEYKKIKIEKEK